ncbi:hypothetical protein BKG60_19240 [Mycobacterium syngnathidarum]|uniref:Uncharacterized protein n=1 Tax=Mycobacterium syngnathidarum TaxID=1908205 RepID=A0A1Q9W8B8_9MYCO|nr:hypothetical protein BKG61_18120 [Mycobacterium syngnathidarum]OLT94408.1 hypothetical protein BKG60_19240 [Mycobacterium syngnathidarum]
MADVVLPALARINIALAGGNGLRVHGVTSRDSTDLDTYTTSWETGVYEEASRAVIEAARSAGWNVEIVASDDFFRSITVWQPGADKERDGVGVDIGQEYRARDVRVVPGGGLVMDLDDIAAGKCRALHDRREANDFADAASLLAHPGWNLARLFDAAKAALPNLALEEFRELLHSVVVISDRELDQTGVAASFIRGVLNSA